MRRGIWLPEEDAVLEQLALEKFFASQIGKKLGRTRHSVIGRAQRKQIRLWGRCNPESHAARAAARRVTMLSRPLYPCGHPRTPENSYLVKQRGIGYVAACRCCKRRRAAESREKRRLAQGETS